MVGYSNPRNDESIARAIGKELKISPKHSVEICRAIRGLHVEAAKQLLQDVIDMKKPVKFRRYNYAISHKKGNGPGRYPVKACKAILKVVESAQENAANPNKKLNPDSMRVLTAAAHRGRVIPGYMPRAHGSSSQWDEQTVNIEIVLEDVEE